MQNKVVKNEKKEGLSHLKARKFFEFVFVVVNAREHATGLFVFVCVVENGGSASYLVHVELGAESSG